VVINGASGGVGTFAVQIAKTLGAEVAAVCSTSKVDMVRSIGADVVVDYHTEDYTKQLRGYNLLFDNAGNRPWSETRQVLTDDGTTVAVTGPKHRIAGPLRRLLFRKLASSFGSQSLAWCFAQVNRDDLDTLGEWLSSGAISPVIERTYDLEHIPDGLRYLSEGHAIGKLVIAT
jgi:NADPH:quinone reductase-like Zn-dependent oxidoreductase